MTQLSCALCRCPQAGRDYLFSSPLSRCSSPAFFTRKRSVNKNDVKHYSTSYRPWKAYVPKATHSLSRQQPISKTVKADVNVNKSSGVSGSSTPYNRPPAETKEENFKKWTRPTLWQSNVRYMPTSTTKPKLTLIKSKTTTSHFEAVDREGPTAQKYIRITTKATKTETGRLKISNVKTATKKYTINTTKPKKAEGGISGRMMITAVKTATQKYVTKVPVTTKITSPNGKKTTAAQIDDRVFTKVSGKCFEYKTIRTKDYTDPPTLAHGLDRVLFNPGVHFLQDPRTSVINFSPYLKKIVQPDDIDFTTFPPYITSSQDPVLNGLAKEHGKKFVGSTSSLTNLMCQIYFLISNGKPPNISMLSKSFGAEEAAWGKTVKEPPSVYLRYKDGVYSVDNDNVSDSEHILLHLGRSMELMLTVSPEEFAKSVKNSPEKPNPDKKKPLSYFYGGHEDFLFRSQLDVHDPRLPGRTFDLKTRGSIGIRLNPRNHEEYIPYHIKTNQGEFESFEREYYDLIRSAFLKYYFQVCIGKMDGVFMAYHNTDTIFGFQYIPKEEMELCLFGNSVIGQEAFGICVKILQDLFKTATSKYPEQSIRLSLNTANPTKKTKSHMTVFTEVVPYDLGLSKEDPRLYEHKADPSLAKYTVEAYSTVNGSELQEGEKVSVSADGLDEWVVHYNIEESTESKGSVIESYNAFSLFQRNFFERNDSAGLSPFHRNIYAIARRNTPDDDVAADFHSSFLEEDTTTNELSPWWESSEYQQIGDVTLYDPLDRQTEDQEKRISPSANAILEKLIMSNDLSKDIADLSKDAMHDILSAFRVSISGPTLVVRSMLSAVVQHYKKDMNARESSTKDAEDDSSNDLKLLQAEGGLLEELSEETIPSLNEGKSHNFVSAPNLLDPYLQKISLHQRIKSQDLGEIR